MDISGLLLFGARWPRTLAGITAYQSCLQYPFTSGNVGSGHEKQAWRHCDRTGRWEEGDYSHCLYTNDITRVLYTFVLVSRTMRAYSSFFPSGYLWAFRSYYGRQANSEGAARNAHKFYPRLAGSFQEGDGFLGRLKGYKTKWQSDCFEARGEPFPLLAMYEFTLNLPEI